MLQVETFFLFLFYPFGTGGEREKKIISPVPVFLPASGGIFFRGIIGVAGGCIYF